MNEEMKVYKLNNFFSSAEVRTLNLSDKSADST